MTFRVSILACLVAGPFAATACSKAAEPAPAEAVVEVAPPEVATPPAPPAEPMNLADLPGPAPGKWKMEATMDARTLPLSEVCLTESTLASMAQSDPGTTCSEQSIERALDGSLKIHAVCTSSTGTTTTIDSVVTGDLNSDYTNTSQMTFDPPPMPGKGTLNVTSHFTRIGDC